jgi:hypothetical protein
MGWLFERGRAGKVGCRMGSRRKGGGDRSVGVFARSRLGTSGVTRFSRAKSSSSTRSLSPILCATSFVYMTCPIFSLLTHPYNTCSKVRDENRRTHASTSTRTHTTSLLLACMPNGEHKFRSNSSIRINYRICVCLFIIFTVVNACSSQHLRQATDTTRIGT